MQAKTGRQAVGMAAAVAVASALVAGSVLLGKGPTRITTKNLTNTTIITQLQNSTKPYPAELQAILRATRATPDDVQAAKAAASALIAQGRAAGDSRLVGAASGVLQPFMQTADVETLNLVATVRQYQHDFNGALRLLDQSIQREPGNATALLDRATIQIVLGRFDLALQDCQSLSQLARPDVGFLCQSTALLLTKNATIVRDRLQRILENPGLLDPSLTGWATGLLGEIAKLQGDIPQAKARFAEVIKANPLALRERLLLADLLLDEKNGIEVLTLLTEAPEVDGVLIRRVLASKITGDESLSRKDTAELERRFRLNLDLGLTAHAREEARYFLEIADNPQLALARAEVNWKLQHEFEDAQLLIDSAVAAGDPAKAAPVLVWIKEQSVEAPSLRIPDAVRKAAL
jgi:tetratricopeptide (TPR) repeat protein